MQKKLKLGIIIDENYIEKWIYDLINEISICDFADIVTIIKTKKDGGNFFNKKIPYLLKLFKSLDQKRLRKNDDILQKISIDEISKEILKIELESIAKEKEKLKNTSLDLLINFSDKDTPIEILPLPKHGVWEICYDSYNFKIPALFEILRYKNSFKVYLKKRTSNVGEEEVIFSTDCEIVKTSLYETKKKFAQIAYTILLSELKKLHVIGKCNFTNNDKLENNLSKISNLTFLAKLLKIFFCRTKEILLSKKYLNQWTLLYSTDKNEKNIANFKKIIPPKDSFFADPFAYYKDNKYYVFFEECPFNTKKGFISVLTIDEKGNHSKPETVLRDSNHYSYPFLIEENGKLYMIPESPDVKQINIYECIDFPLKWKFKKTLIDNIRAADTTIIKKDGKYWLFTGFSKQKYLSGNGQMYIFYADSLFSENWKPHPLNPVIISRKNARMAGGIFEQNGELFRPSQNCLKHYGESININKIIKLNEKEYEETIVSKILPEWERQVISCHTINQCNKLTVIDAEIRRKK